MGEMQLDPGFVESVFTEDKNGKRTLDEGAFAEAISELWHCVCYNGLLYDGTGEIISLSDCKSEVYKMLRRLNVSTNLAKRTNNIVDAIRLQAHVDHIDVPPNLIAFQNGALYIDMKTGEITMASEPVFSLHRLNCKFNPSSKAKTPTRFLEWVHNLIHEEDIPGFQEYLGYLLLPNTKLQKAMILIGQGQEGKSRIGLILHYLFGFSCETSSIDFFENNSFAMPRAENKLVLFQDDLKRDKLKSTETFKSMVSAEIPMQAEKKGENAYSFLPYARWVICSNAPLAALYDTGYAFYRRLYPIRVKNRPPDRKDDPFYFDPMKGEMDGIFVWLLQGLQRLIVNGWALSQSQESKDLVETQRDKEDSVFVFAKSEILYGKNLTASNDDLYKAYSSFCIRNGLIARKKDYLVQFFDEQQDNIKIKQDKHVGENRTLRGYRGMAVKTTVALKALLDDAGGEDHE